MEIDIKSAKALTEVIFIDVREVDEWRSGHISGATHLALSELVKGRGIDSLNPDKKYVIYCQHGVRSLTALNILKGLDFKEVYSLKGGFAKWQGESK